MPRGLALALLECQGIGNAKGSAIGFTSMPRGLSLASFLGYLITRLRATVQLDCRVACNHATAQYPKIIFRFAPVQAMFGRLVPLMR